MVRVTIMVPVGVAGVLAVGLDPHPVANTATARPGQAIVPTVLVNLDIYRKNGTQGIQYLVGGIDVAARPHTPSDDTPADVVVGVASRGSYGTGDGAPPVRTRIG